MVEIEAHTRENENGEKELILTVKSISKRMDYKTEWVADQESGKLELVDGKKRIAGGDHPTGAASKHIIDTHRKYVKKYLQEKDIVDEDDYDDEDDDEKGEDDDEKPEER